MSQPITRRHHAQLRLSALLGGAALLLPAPLAWAQDEPHGDDIEIIVTANKRDQVAIDVPASIDILSASELEAARVTRIEDLAGALANVDVAEFSDGQYRLIYRGIGATGTSDNQNFNTAIDNVIVPYGRAYRLLDLDHVEIMRGPQGTLYGRNTNAGVINMVTRDGRGDPPTTFSASYGTGETRSVSAAFGGESENGVFFRVAGRGERTNGFIENHLLGDDEAHSSDNGTLRATLGFESGPWLARLSLTYDEYDGKSDDLLPYTTPFVSNAPSIGASSGNMILPILTVAHEGRTVDFTSTTAFAATERNLTASAVISPLVLGQFDSYDSFSQEFRLNGQTNLFGGNLEWITGLYYLHETNPFRSTLVFGGMTLLDQNQERTTEAYALFGEAVYDFTEHWRLTAGLRLGAEEQHVEYRASASAPLETSDETYPTVQPKLALAYRWNDAQIYGSVTRGFRAGSVFIGNAPTLDPAYDEEETWQYELGYKAELADGRVNVEAALFYIDWSDLQVQRSVLTTTTPPSIATIVDNATSASSWGGEASISWTPIDDLTLSAAAGYTHARYEDYEPTPGVSYADHRIELTPEYSFSLGAGWRPAIGLGGGAEVRRVGPMMFDAANSIEQPAYTLLNADLSYAFENVRFSLVGRNLLDEAYANRGLVQAGAAYVHFADPQTITAEISASF